MATGLDRFAAHLKAIEQNLGEFQAKPYYEAKTDSLIYYFRDESAYSKRVTKYFTVFLSNHDDSVVGIEVKGLKTIFKALEGLDRDTAIVEKVPVKDEGGESFDLSVIVRCALVPNPEEPVKGEQYAELDNCTRGVPINKRKMCKSA